MMKVTMIFNCQHCNKEFEGYFSNKKKNKNIFCSLDCAYVSRIKTRTPQELFSRCTVNEKGCWVWQGNKKPSGYGYINHNGKKEHTHRLMWELNNYMVPKGMSVCHVCDNPSCINPNHLFLGTAQDNATDKVNKDRQLKHETHPAAKLTKKQVNRIKLLLKCNKYFHREIAEHFSVCAGTISAISRSEIWK